MTETKAEVDPESEEIEYRWKSYCDFENCKRMDGNQPVTEFLEIWQKRLREVQNYGITFSHYVLALKLVYSCQLAQQVEKCLVVSLHSSYKEEDSETLLLQIMVEMIKMYNDQELVKIEQDSDFEVDNDDDTWVGDYAGILDQDDVKQPQGVEDSERGIKEEKEDKLIMRLKMESLNSEDIDFDDSLDLDGGGYDGEDSLPALCSACGSSLETAQSYKEHILTCKPLIAIGKLDDGSEFPCGICAKISPTLQKLKYHIRDNHLQKYPCPKCPRRFGRKFRLDNHMMKHVAKEFVNESDLYDNSIEGKRENAEATCSGCNTTVKSITAYKSHVMKCSRLEEISKSDNQEFPCGLCKRVSPGWQNLKWHINSSHLGNYPCPRCLTTFKTQERMEHHLARHLAKEMNAKKEQEQVDKKVKMENGDGGVIHIENLPDAPEADAPPEVDDLVEGSCSACGKSTKSTLEYKDHIIACKELKELEKSGKENVYPCGICNKSLQRLVNLKWHMRDNHMGKFKCDVCQRRFKNPDLLEGHMRKSHPTDQELQCEHCGREFEDARKLKKHLHSHNNFRCMICKSSFKFSTQEALEDHQRKHKEITCETCKQVFPSQPVYTNHFYAGKCTKIEMISCDECGKTYSSKRKLTYHKKLHKERAHVCPKEGCGRSFTFKYDMQEHIRRHEGVKPFKCDYCPMTFAGRGGLKRHLDSHLDNRRYPCEECGKAFMCKSVLRVHIRTHTGEKPNKCDQCDKAFNRKFYLNKHKRVAHGAP